MLTAFRALHPGRAAWLDVGERCVELLCLVQRVTDAVDVAGQLLAYLDDDESVGRLEVALSRALWLKGYWKEAGERTRRTRARAGLSTVTRSRLEALHALTLARVDSPEAARPVAEHALEQSAADRTGRLFAVHALAEIARNAGDHRTSLKHFRRLREESEPTYLAQEIMALQHLDRYEHAGGMLTRALAENESAAVLPSLLYARIWQEFNLGRLDHAEATAGRLMTLGREIGSRVCQLESAAVLSGVALMRGEAAEARRRITLGGLAAADDYTHIPVLVLVHGWLLAAEGDLQQAVGVLKPLLDEAFHERDPWPWKPGWLPLVAGIGAAAGDRGLVGAAVELAGDGARRNPGVATFEALALGLRARLDGDPGGLARAAGVAAASPRPLVRADALAEHGRALFAAGETEAAVAALDQAWQVYDDTGARAARREVQRTLRQLGVRRRTEPVADERPVTGWESLTEAEKRVSRLVAAGHTNRAVGARLNISANTVGTHLRSAFSKLDVRSRVQLTNVMNQAEPGLTSRAN